MSMRLRRKRETATAHVTHTFAHSAHNNYIPERDIQTLM